MISVTLPPELEELVNAKVQSGQYHSSGEVIREGLRLLQEKDTLWEAKGEKIICIDNSVAIKWIVEGPEEHNWEKARHWLALWRQEGIKLIAPPIFDIEFRTVLQRKSNGKDNGKLISQDIWKDINLMRSLVEIRTHPELEYMSAAFERYLIPMDIQDTTYMALAALNNCEFWTHDDKWKDNETGRKLRNDFPFIKLLQIQDYPAELLVPQFEKHETDEALVKQLNADILLTKLLNPHHPRKVKDAVIILPGISGDGSNGTPDYIDREHSTASIDTQNHTIG